MKLNKNMQNNFRHAAILAVAALTPVLHSCDAIYDDEDDCSHYIHFKYDYNMKYADAFPHEVHKVTLYAIDQSGKVVWQKSESGPALARDGYCMSVDVNPGEYDFIAWCGAECGAEEPTTFAIPETNIMTELTATLGRVHDGDGSAHIRTDVDRLYYGIKRKVNIDWDLSHDTIPLMKNTNNIRVILQHLSGEPVDRDQFTYTITDNNGFLNWNNDVLPDETINYHAWHVGSGTAVTGPQHAPQADGTRTQSTYSTALAEFTVSRLMADHAPGTRLIVRRADNGETIININLIDALLLVKGYYNRDMSDQEYLDRQDEYSLTFFLDEGFRWMNSYIYINSWRVVLQNSQL